MIQSLTQKYTACGQLSKVAARLAKIMHYDPKIDHFCKKPCNDSHTIQYSLCTQFVQV